MVSATSLTTRGACPGERGGFANEQRNALATELARLRRRIEEIALVHPSVAFQLMDAQAASLLINARKVRLPAGTGRAIAP